MNILNKIPKPVTRFAGKMLIKLRQASPELFIIVGLACGGAAIALVGTQTYKHKDDIEQDRYDIRAVSRKTVTLSEKDVDALSERMQKKVMTDDETGEKFIIAKTQKDEMTEEQRKALWDARFAFAKDMVKIYWAPAALSVGSVFLIWGGRTKLRKSLSEMTMMYTMAVSKYKQLYEKIREEYGEEKAQELVYGAHNATYVDAETGEVGTTVYADPEGNCSQYAQIFDQGEFDNGTGEWIWKNGIWSESKIVDYLAVKEAQDEAYRQIMTKGWCIWGEIKQEKLGMKPMPGDFRVGWWYKPGLDNHVDFRVFDERWQLPFNRGFADVDNEQKVCMIDPNIDGCIDFIFDDIEKYDFRCGRRSPKNSRVPNDRQMFGEKFARKLHW